VDEPDYLVDNGSIVNTPNAQPLLLQGGYDCGDEPEEEEEDSNQDDLSREDDDSASDNSDEEDATKRNMSQREENKEAAKKVEKEPAYDYDNEDLMFDLEGKIDYNDNLSKHSTQVTTNDHLKFISSFGSNNQLQKSKSKRRVKSRR